MNKEKKIILRLVFPQTHFDLMTSLMEKTKQINPSSFIFFLLANEEQRQLELQKKLNPVGRPRKEEEEYEPEPDYTDDLPKNIIYMGSMIGPREKADIDERHRALKEMGI
ncbi:MAG: hypothetical protein V4436_02080 [Patescibacteria group bacterium]